MITRIPTPIFGILHKSDSQQKGGAKMYYLVNLIGGGGFKLL